MSTAILEVNLGNKCFPLFPGLYLIGGARVTSNVSQFNIILDNESLEAKHAFISVEEASLTICDLDTTTGTYLKGERLTSLIKFPITRTTPVRFGDVEGTIRFCDNVSQTSGIHEDSLKNSNADQIPIATTTVDADMSRKSATDSFTIVDTQFVVPKQMSTGDNAFANVSKDSNDSCIPETQDIPVSHNSTPNIPKSNLRLSQEKRVSNASVEESQFCMGTQEFNDCLGIEVDSDSNDLLNAVSWMLEDNPATSGDNQSKTEATNAKQLTADVEIEMEALHWSNSTMPKGDSSTQHDAVMRSMTQTPDMFDNSLPDSEDVQINNENNKNQSSKKDAKSESKSSTKDETCVKTTGEKSGTIANSESSASDQPLPLSNKENMEMFAADSIPTTTQKDNIAAKPIPLANTDLEPTQKFVPKKDLLKRATVSKNIQSKPTAVNTDFEPTQVFIPKTFFNPPSTSTPEVRSSINNDLIPTQLFIPRQPTNKDDDEVTKKTLTVEKAGVTSLEITSTPEAGSNVNNDLIPTQLFIPRQPTNKDNDKLTKKTLTVEKAVVTSLETMEMKQQAVDIDMSKQAISDENPASPVAEGVLHDYEFVMKTPKLISDCFDADMDISLTRSSTRHSTDDDEGGLEHLLKNSRNVRQFDSLIPVSQSTPPKEKSTPKKETKANENNTHVKDVDNPSVVVDSSNRKRATKRNAPSNEILPAIVIENSVDETSKQNASQTTTSTADGRRKRLRTQSNQSLDGEEPTETATKMKSKKKVTDTAVTATTSRKTRTTRATPAIASLPTIVDEELSKSNSKIAKTALINTRNDLRLPSVQKIVSFVFEQPDCQTEKESTTDTNAKPSTSKPPGKEKDPIANKRSTRLRSADTVATTSAKANDVESCNSTKNSTSSTNTLKKTRSQVTTSSTKIVGRKRTRVAASEATELKKSKLTDVQSVKNENNKEQEAVAADGKPEKASSSKLISPQKEQQAIISDGEPEQTSSSSIKATKIIKDIIQNLIKKKSAIEVAFSTISLEKQNELTEPKSKKWHIARDSVNFDILVMDVGSRTVKFLIALAKGIPIVTTSWLESLNRTGKATISPTVFLKDSRFERNFQFSLLQTLNAANERKLFTGYEFFLTPNILPEPSDMKSIITAAGGTVLTEKSPSIENSNFYIVSIEKDSRRWHGYRRKNPNVRITSTEGVMVAIMRYNVEILEKHLFA